MDRKLKYRIGFFVNCLITSTLALAIPTLYEIVAITDDKIEKVSACMFILLFMGVFLARVIDMNYQYQSKMKEFNRDK